MGRRNLPASARLLSEGVDHHDAAEVLAVLKVFGQELVAASRPSGSHDELTPVQR